MSDQIVYLNVGDGPDGIKIYSSRNQAIVDSGSSMHDGVYVDISMMGAMCRFGPMLPSLIDQLPTPRDKNIASRGNENE